MSAYGAESARFHVPARLTPKTPKEVEIGHIERSNDELMKAMAEKRMALDFVEGYVSCDIPLHTCLLCCP